MLGSNNYNHILNCLSIAKKDLGDSVSAIEYLDWESLKLSIDYLEMQYPFQNISSD